MRILIADGEGSNVDRQLLATRLETDYGAKLAINSEIDDGVQLWDCINQTKIKWDWPDLVIVAGTCEIGRHHADNVLAMNEDMTGALLDIIETQEGNFQEETEA